MSTEIEQLCKKIKAMTERVYELREQEYKLAVEKYPIGTIVNIDAKVVGHICNHDYALSVDDVPEVTALKLEIETNAEHMHEKNFVTRVIIPIEQCRLEEK